MWDKTYVGYLEYLFAITTKDKENLLTFLTMIRELKTFIFHELATYFTRKTIFFISGHIIQYISLNSKLLNMKTNRFKSLTRFQSLGLILAVLTSPFPQLLVKYGTQYISVFYCKSFFPFMALIAC